MDKFKLKAGWTKEKVMAWIKKYNNGTRAMLYSVDDNDRCLYKTETGNRCAIGCFIPDNEKAALESPDGVSALLSDFPHLTKHLPFDDRVALVSFQKTHDQSNITHNGDVYAAIQEFLDTRVSEA